MTNEIRAFRTLTNQKSGYDHMTNEIRVLRAFTTQKSGPYLCKGEAQGVGGSEVGGQPDGGIPAAGEE